MIKDVRLRVKGAGSGARGVMPQCPLPEEELPSSHNVVV